MTTVPLSAKKGNQYRMLLVSEDAGVQTKPVVEASSSDSRSTGSSSSSDSSDSTGSSVEGDPGAHSSTSRDSGSGSSSDSAEFCDRGEMLDHLDRLDAELEESRADAEEAAARNMPPPIMCEQTSDLLVAWNDMLATGLRSMRAREGSGDSQEDPKDGSAEEDKAEADHDERTLVLLRVNAAPAGPDNAKAYAEARAKCVPFRKAAEQVAAVCEAHDLMLKCQDTDNTLSRKKLQGDMSALKNALHQLQKHAKDTIRQQAEEQEAMDREVRKARGKMAPKTYVEETARLRAIVAALPAKLPQRDLWLQQTKAAANENTLLVITEAILDKARSLCPGEWAALMQEVEEELAEVDRVTPVIRAKMDLLEECASANAIDRGLVRRAKALLVDVREEVALRSDRHALLENEIYVVRQVRNARIRELRADFMATQNALCDATVSLVSRNQNAWRIAMSKLFNDCVHPMLEQAMSVNEAMLPPRSLVPYRNLRVEAEKDWHAARCKGVEDLVEFALSLVPEVQRIRDEFADQHKAVLTTEARE